MPQNIVIFQCLADQLFALAFGFDKKLPVRPSQNQDILLNLVSG